MIDITESSLEEAWVEALKKCHAAPGGQLGTTCVTFGVSSVDAMAQSVEEKLDAFLLAGGRSTVHTVANTIFPLSVWRWSDGDRQRFYRRCYEMWPHVRRIQQNRRGIYFIRLIDFAHKTEKDSVARSGDTEEAPVNQLENIITTWNDGNHRFSALQAAIYDPRRDFSDARRLGFPCLQQIAFRPHGTGNGKKLDVVAFYAKQLLVEKAYGNYLGLRRLGQFMASEMGLELSRVSCIAGSLDLADGISKRALAPLVHEVSKVTNAE